MDLYYGGFSSKEEQSELKKARRRVAEMDAYDKANGNPTPMECGICEFLRTVITALSCHEKDKGAFYDGVAMIQMLELSFRKSKQG